MSEVTNLEKAAEALRDLLLEIVDDENVQCYPGAIERSGPRAPDFEQWEIRVRAAIDNYDRSK